MPPLSAVSTLTAMLGYEALLPEHRLRLPDADTRRGLILLSAFLLASMVSAWYSQGVYHEDDLTHYLFARWSHNDARYLVDCWGRPGFTIPYSWPAAIGNSPEGLRACRTLSAFLSGATAWLCFCIARRLGMRRAWPVIPLLYLQPLFATLSLTTLTETPLAFYFALATWLILSGRTEWSAAVVALAPLTRDEAVIVLPLWSAAIWIRGGRWWAHPLLLWGVAAHNLVSGAWLGFWPALRWVRPSGADQYGQGTLLTFVPKLAYASGPVIVALAILGVRRIARRPLGWLLILCAAAWFGAETLIYMRAAYSSGGYARFLVPICPWLAILGCSGIRPLFVRKTVRPALTSLSIVTAGILLLCEVEWQWRIPVTAPEWHNWVIIGRAGAVLAAVVLAVCSAVMIKGSEPRSRLAMRFASFLIAPTAFVGITGLLPLKLGEDQICLRTYSPGIARLAQEGRPVLTLNRWCYHWTDLSVPWAAFHDPTDSVERARPGTIFVWDKRFCTEPGTRLTYAQLQSRAEWRLLWATELAPDESVPYLACFERQGVMQAAKPPPGQVRD